ncbi:VWA domain-containing protein [Mycolicibacterium sp.]|uniref:VWA domain-containing protein n=1 Tax=Mycolicibacterium sp. TaxID=2320850 RepID=UPI0037C7777C
MTTLQPTETDLTRFYALFPQPALARDLFNIIEGHRIDSAIRRAYPGIRRDMDAIQAASAGRRPDLAGLPESQAVAEALLQHTLGLAPDVSTLPDATGKLIADAVALLEEVAAPDTGVAAAAALTGRIYIMIEEHLADPTRRSPEQSPSAEEQQEQPRPDGAEPESEPEQPQGAGGEDEDYQPLELPPFMTPVMEQMVRPESDAPAQRPIDQPDSGEDPSTEQDGAQAESESDSAMNTSQTQRGQGDQDDVAQSTSSEGDDEAPPGTADGRSDDAEGTGSDSPTQTGLGDVPQVEPEAVEDDLGEQVFQYDEWDHKIEDYRPGWCTLTEHRQTRTQEGFVASTFHEFGGIVTQIRRNFQLMRPERLRKMRFQEDGDDLDTDGLVEYVVDRRARVSSASRVYIKRDKKDRDVTTAFLVDMSSSTDRKIDGRKRIIDIEKEALLLMCEALEAIRDEYAIYGFSGSGREDAQFYVVKELGERYDDRVKGRIGGIYARQKTRMGPAIRHATRRLAAADSQVKLMILLTDGKPYDSDTYQDNTYAQEDTKMALREARREKIHLFCVTVDREGADYLPHMYSDANFVIIDDVRTLPQKLPQLYRRLTT